MESLFIVNDLVVANIGDDIAGGIRDFIGPILMLIVGIVAITFLVKREMTQFIIFLAIAVVVFIIFFAPDVLKTIAEGTEEQMKTGGEWN